jgi:hypothetical protein
MAGNKLPDPQQAGANSPINEPQRDWVSIKEAPFFFLSDGHMQTSHSWQDAFFHELQDKISNFHVGHLPKYLVAKKRPEWSFHREIRSGAVFCETTDTSLSIVPGFVELLVAGRAIMGDSDTLLNDSEWSEIPPHDREAAEWIKLLLKRLFATLRQNYLTAINSGTANIMARRSVLAPFERIKPDQWRFFSLVDAWNEERPDFANKSQFERPAWHDPREDSRNAPIIARGPQGEWLYSIYVAPGQPVKDSFLSEVEKCLRKLQQLMRDYPERCPMPVDALLKELTSEFSTLSKKQAEMCVLRARMDTGNHNWLRPGRPAKSAQKYPPN